MSDVGFIKEGSIPADQQLIGIHLDKTFTDRDELDDYLREGDTVHIQTLEMIASSPADLYGFLEQMVPKGIKVKFYKEEVTITNDENNQISKFLLQSLKAYAEMDWAFYKGGWR